MLDGKGGFVPLPVERVIHKSSPRISLAITTSSAYPGNNPLAIHCSSGIVYLTNQRVSEMNKAEQKTSHTLTPYLDSVPSRQTNVRAQILLCAVAESARYTRDRPLVRTERMASNATTRSWRQPSRNTSGHRTQIDIQGRWRTRLPFKFGADQRKAAASGIDGEREQSDWHATRQPLGQCQPEYCSS